MSRGRSSFVSLLLFGTLTAIASAASDLPVYVAKQPNLHDYTLFANSGWDGNWFVGYNSAWIKRMPTIPPGVYERAYIGVKLGRAKRNAQGKIFAAIASTPAWTAHEQYLITTTEEIPLEGEASEAIEGVGESQWFWTAIPLSAISASGSNYIAVWSNTPAFVSISSSPVIAAAWGGKDPDTWLAKDLQGQPPTDPKVSIQTPISYFQPAIALKLIPQGAAHSMTVRVVDWKQGTADHLKPTVIADVRGDGIEKVWLEYGKGSTWTKVGRPVWQPPYHLTLEQSQLPKGKIQLRVAASNIWEDISMSPPFSIEVSPIDAKK